LLPSTTIDKVLEKANMDYESESQKECQDILDSIDDLIDFEGLKERDLHPSDQNHSPRTSSENIIPQVDGSGDEFFSTPCARSTGKSSGMETRDELEGSLECHTLQDVGGRFTSKHKRKQSVWGSLPFSTTKKVNNDLDPVGFHIIDSCVHETKAPEGTRCLAINEAGSYAAGFMKNADADVHDLKESSTLVGCSVRDLMRRKRSYRVEPPDCGSHRDKRVLLEGEQRDGIILCPRQLNDEVDRKPIESLNLKPSFTDQQTDFHKAYEVNVTHSDCSVYDKHPLLSSSDSLSQRSKLKDGNFGSHEKVTDGVSIVATTGPVDFTVKGASQVHTVPLLSKPNNVNSAASTGHCEICNDKESDLGATAMTNERFPQKDAAASSCLQTGLIECKVSGAHYSIYESGHKYESSVAWVHNKSYENRNTMTDSMGLLNENCGGEKQGRDFVFSGLGSSASIVVNTQVKCTELIGMTFSKKPPIADWTDGTTGNASFPPTASGLEEKNYEGTSGCISALLHGMQYLFSFSFSFSTSLLA